MTRFTIRDLLFLFALVGTALGWWIDRHALVISRNQAFADCETLGCLCEPGKHIGDDAIRDYIQPIWDKYCSWPRPPEVKAAWAYNRRHYGHSQPSRRTTIQQTSAQ